MKSIIAFLVVFFVSCSTTEPHPLKDEAWVCHNPESTTHGALCGRVVDIVRGEYETCFWKLDGSNYGRGSRNEEAFCWLLRKEDCIDVQVEWQRASCHLLGPSQ